jgi:hypothetical protein
MLRKCAVSGVFFAVLQCGGCGTHYVAPTSGPTAIVAIESRVVSEVSIGIFDDANECFTAHGAAWLEPGKSTELPVVAGKPLAMHFQLTGISNFPTVTICNLGITWKPMNDGRYKAVISQTKDGCAVNVHEVVGGGGSYQEVPFIGRKIIPPVGFTGIWCAALTDEQKALLH